MDRFNDGADVDDILVCSWGYDQTNVDFYKVTRRTKSSAWIVKVGQQIIPGSEGFMSESVLPDPDRLIPWTRYSWDTENPEAFKPKLKRVQHATWSGGDGRAYLTMTSYSSAHPYEGGSMYQSHYA